MEEGAGGDFDEADGDRPRLKGTTVYLIHIMNVVGYGANTN